jgi:hypothetical protein
MSHQYRLGVRPFSIQDPKQQCDVQVTAIFSCRDS